MFGNRRKKRLLHSELAFDILWAIDNYEKKSQKERLIGNVYTASMYEHDANVLKSVFYKGARAKMIWDDVLKEIEETHKE